MSASHWDEPAACSLFHGGRVLEAAQASGAWSDSKAFVDCPAVRDSAAVLAAFDAAAAEGAPSWLPAFLAAHFAPPGTELQSCQPVDWQPLGWTQRLPCEEARGFARSLHALWPTLCRRAAPTAGVSTLLPLPHPCFVPGDRFREVYYWDTYWIVRGLLACEMRQSAAGAVRNLLSLLSTHGFVPNGARSYYLRRSQPPLLSAMVAAVAERMGDEGEGDALLAEALPLLLAEWAFWTSGSHAVHVRAPGAAGREFWLSRYHAEQETARPESWREDCATAAGLPPPAAAALFRQLATAAESGWDFSSRWMDGRRGGGLRSLRATRILPADLNAFLCAMAGHIAAFAARLGRAALAAEYRAKAEERRDAIHALLWDDAAGQWRDFELDDDEDAQPLGARGGARSSRVFASNWVPLWCGVADAGGDQALRAVRSLAASGLLLPGGLGTSLEESGEQWDGGNSWPPLVHMCAEGCARFGGEEGAAQGGSIAARYLRGACGALARDGVMHEKLDARAGGGAAGGGGEYAPQVGFGWSNGAALALLEAGLGVAEAWPLEVTDT